MVTVCVDYGEPACITRPVRSGAEITGHPYRFFLHTIFGCLPEDSVSSVYVCMCVFACMYCLVKGIAVTGDDLHFDILGTRCCIPRCCQVKLCFYNWSFSGVFRHLKDYAASLALTCARSLSQSELHRQ